MRKAIIGLQKGSGKWSKVREKSGNFEMFIEWQPSSESYLDGNCLKCACIL